MKNLSNTRCLIVTLCKSPNYGAYLQAFALQEVLTDYGYQVSFLDIYDRKNNIKRFKSFFQGWKRKPRSILFGIKKMLAFNLAEKNFNLVSRDESSGFQVAFIGSDEIWNITNKSFDNIPEFFGLNLSQMQKFSYAPSVGNSDISDLVCCPEYIEGLKNFDMLSVRDSESFDIAKKITGREDISMVLDPTFLYDFDSKEESCHIEGQYLLVYTYNFSKDVISEVQEYAKEKGLSIVSAGFYHSWADKNISCGPFEFLNLVKFANCVFTDTFHGSIFAIKYRKNFLSYGKHKKKVKYLIESLGLKDTLVGPGFLQPGYDIRTDYEECEEILRLLISKSRDYIESCNDIFMNR